MSGLSQFYSLLKDVQKLSAWVLPAAGITPVITALGGLSPPWPDKIGLVVCTSFASLVALVFVFQFLDRGTAKNVNRTLSVALAVIIPTGVIYFAAHSLLVYRTPVTDEAFVQGFSCSAVAQQIHGTKCPWLDIYDMKEAEFESSLLWTQPSITAARLTLVSLWLALFSASTVLLAAFASHQKRKGLKRRTVKTKAETA